MCPLALWMPTGLLYIAYSLTGTSAWIKTQMLSSRSGAKSSPNFKCPLCADTCELVGPKAPCKDLSVNVHLADGKNEGVKVLGQATLCPSPGLRLPRASSLPPREFWGDVVRLAADLHGLTASYFMQHRIGSAKEDLSHPCISIPGQLSSCAASSSQLGALLLIPGEGGGQSLKYAVNLISAQLFPFRLV